MDHASRCLSKLVCCPSAGLSSRTTYKCVEGTFHDSSYDLISYLREQISSKAEMVCKWLPNYKIIVQENRNKRAFKDGPGVSWWFHLLIVSSVMMKICHCLKTIQVRDQLHCQQKQHIKEMSHNLKEFTIMKIVSNWVDSLASAANRELTGHCNGPSFEFWSTDFFW